MLFSRKKETEQKERKAGKDNRFVSSVTGFWDSLAALPAYNFNKCFLFIMWEFKELN